MVLRGTGPMLNPTWWTSDGKPRDVTFSFFRRGDSKPVVHAELNMPVEVDHRIPGW